MDKKPSKKANPTVICGTDFSPAASEAADVAAAVSRMMGIPLELVHARIIRAYPPMDEELKAEADRLRALKTDVREHMVVGEGFADEELVGLVKRKSCRLLVVASHGKRSPDRWTLGKVSERTAERSSAPTLVVRNSQPFLEWERDERPLHVFVAYERTRTSEAALIWAKELMAIGHCELTVGHVYYPPEQRIRLGLKGKIPPAGNPPQLQAILERDLSESAAKILGTHEFKAAVEPFWTDPENTLADMARISAADLLVVGSHQYHGFELVWNTSVSREILHRAKTNVAVIPFATLRSKPAAVAPAVQKVLVATDFSDLANQAIPHAYSLLGGGGRIHLIHVIHPYELSDGEYLLGPLDPVFKRQHAKLRKTRRQMLEACIPADAVSFGISTDIEVVENVDAAQGIVESAERFGADAICIGTHGRTGLASAILGSTAMALLRLSDKPVYLVRPLAD
jgi:nucleotide-binding universal stress UspA family protein